MQLGMCKLWNITLQQLGGQHMIIDKVVKFEKIEDAD